MKSSLLIKFGGDFTDELRSTCTFAKSQSDEILRFAASIEQNSKRGHSSQTFCSNQKPSGPKNFHSQSKVIFVMGVLNVS